MSDPSLLVTRPTATDPGLAPRRPRPAVRPRAVPEHRRAGPIDWPRVGPAYRDELLRVLEARGIGLDGLAGEIEVSRLVTPADWAADGMGAGTPFALAHTFAQTGPFRPRNLVRGLDNAVLAGCGTTPGVGIPPVLISGPARRGAGHRAASREAEGPYSHADGPRASIGHDMTAQPSSPVDEPATPERVAAPPARVLTAAPRRRTVADGRPQRRRGRFGAPPRGPLLTGLAASLLMMIGGFGGGGILVRDPILTNSAARASGATATATSSPPRLIYLGVVLMAWAWIRLGREVLARAGRRAGGAHHGRCLADPDAGRARRCSPATCSATSPRARCRWPGSTRTPSAPRPCRASSPRTSTTSGRTRRPRTGRCSSCWPRRWPGRSGTNIIAGVLLMRLTLVLGLVLLVWALPELTRRLGGRRAGGAVGRRRQPDDGHPHGRRRAQRPARHGPAGRGSLFALRGRHVVGIALVTAAMAVKASAGVALPFLVLVWAAHMSRLADGPGSPRPRPPASASSSSVFGPDHPRRAGGPGLAARAQRPVA